MLVKNIVGIKNKLIKSNLIYSLKLCFLSLIVKALAWHANVTYYLNQPIFYFPWLLKLIILFKI